MPWRTTRQRWYRRYWASIVIVAALLTGILAAIAIVQMGAG